MSSILPDRLLDLPLAALQAEARAIRSTSTGNRITFSPKVFIPLTMLCRDKCGYCTFAKPPARLESPYLSPEEVLAIARLGAAAGCHEALFTLGEAPELRYEVAANWLSEHGYDSTVDYLAQMCRMVVQETGLLPHANAGALSDDDLESLRSATASQGMMLESLRDDLDCHRGSPDKTPQRRLATLDSAGKLGIPFTTGILVGIGENRSDRIEALTAIAQSHATHGHVQEVIVQNFLPKPGTAMFRRPPCPLDELLWSIAVARILLPPEVHIQAPPNLSDDLSALLGSGLDDWGGVSPVTKDHVNPERAWPALEALRFTTESAGFTLAPRLTIYPAWARNPERWIHPDMTFAVLDVTDCESLARSDTWCSGGDVSPPQILADSETSDSETSDSETSNTETSNTETSKCASSKPHIRRDTTRIAGRVAEVLAGVASGSEVGEDEIVALFSARGPEVDAVADTADRLRSDVNGPDVTWVANRNINYTNVCTFKCKFCAFSKGPLSLNLRGDPYLLSLDEISERVVEAEAIGATEVCLQGGIHPKFDGNTYLEVIRAVRKVSDRIHIHGFTALEVTEGARRLGIPLEDYLTELKDAGLATLPGTAAEVLDDEVRAILCPDKINTDQWLNAHRTAHSVGLRSNVTIMFGAIESPISWARHLVRTRDLQKETGGFTEFVPLPFVHMATPLYLQRRARRGPTFREALLMHAVGRIAYHGHIDNIQASWVKLGAVGLRQLLQAGVNDLGGTLMEENISRAAGAEHGQMMTEDEFRSVVEPLGRNLRQRTTLYKPVMATTSR